jgi:hypothetical protein
VDVEVEAWAAEKGRGEELTKLEACDVHIERK